MIKYLTIGIPVSKGGVAPDTIVPLFSNLFDLISQGIISNLKVMSSPYTDEARNQLIEESGHTDAVLFLDSDIILPQKAILHLIEDDKPIVAGLYYRSIKPHYPMIMHKTNDGYIYLHGERGQKCPPGLVEVDATGAGCLLVKREVLDSLIKPYFWRIKPNQTDEVAFCEKAKAAGFNIFVDCDVFCGHATNEIVGYNPWEAKHE